MVVKKDAAVDGARKRKVHSKSRKGCLNCKLRRVKCDEEKPRCKVCISYGVACNYDKVSPELQFSGHGAFQVDFAVVPRQRDPTERLIDSMLGAPVALHVEADSPGPPVFHLDQSHVELLHKYQMYTVRTMGTADSIEMYRVCMIEMASTHSFLLHAVLKFTMLHQRYLNEPITAPESTAEVCHAFHGLALYGQTLAQQPLPEKDKDPLWATAAIFGACSFASTDATCAAEAWPLKSVGPHALDWLKMSEGKREVFRMANPLRVGSRFRTMLVAEHDRRIASPARPIDPNLDRLFPYVTRLYNLGASRTANCENDPYYTAASIIERLVPITCDHSTVMWFLSFLGYMEPEFRELLAEKDPQAMLLLSWWYAKMIPYGVWWLSRRCVFECQAICMYLDRELPPGHEIRPLLDFPRSMCGL